MEIGFPNALVLEQAINEEEKKDPTTGVYEKTGKVYHKVVIYPFGQESHQKVVVCGVKPEQVAHVASLVGKRCSVTVDMRQTDKYTFYDFVSARGAAAQVEEKKAA